jgi:hypothetical protein
MNAHVATYHPKVISQTDAADYLSMLDFCRAAFVALVNRAAQGGTGETIVNSSEVELFRAASERIDKMLAPA